MRPFEKGNEFMPTVLEETMNVLDILHPNASENCKLNILLAKTAQMVSFKRVYYKEFENSGLINHYAINFMPSGAGKDKICKDLDKFIFEKFVLHFKRTALDYVNSQKFEIEKYADNKFPDDKAMNKKEDYIASEQAKIRYLDIELNNATPEGFFSDAKAFKLAEFGSVFVKISEFGLFLQNRKKDDLQYFTTLYEGYDGRVSSKSTKHEQRECSIENIPINILLHSDFSLFKTDIQSSFTTLMQTGLARRAFVSFQSKSTKYIDPNPVNIRMKMNKAYSEARSINSKLYDTFLQIPENAVYELTDDAHDNVLYPYIIKVDEMYNSCDDSLLCKEIDSRKLKVLKLSGMFACLNHPADNICKKNYVEEVLWRSGCVNLNRRVY